MKANEELQNKFGDARVLGVAREVTDGVLRSGFTCRKDAVKMEGNICYPLNDLIRAALEPRLRCDAELDASFKQIIPYMVLEHESTGRIYTTLRLGGDNRLIGQASIGLGGHMDEGEDFEDCLMRELYEEIGLKSGDIRDLQFCGYLYSEQSEVDSVHVGMVYRAKTSREEVRCLEEEKLSGAWLTRHELINLKGDGKLESWSRIVFDEVLGGSLDEDD
jgi:predicted NUDIX family phosphoesterase